MSLVADGKLPPLIPSPGPQFPILAPCIIMLRLSLGKYWHRFKDYYKISTTLLIIYYLFFIPSFPTSSPINLLCLCLLPWSIEIFLLTRRCSASLASAASRPV